MSADQIGYAAILGSHLPTAIKKDVPIAGRTNAEPLLSSHTEFRDLETDHCRQDFTVARPIEVWSKVALTLVDDCRSEI
ncbi:MAG: hypothetical protein VYC98_11995 [Planctomycetota bacterium]|nr:hypothetical protein [Planctomycetota bacterium]MEC7718529.1 hypothetical protein [Planctomycetota bacterium]MEE3074233.1 hypothetical protein [Planctomycetota bacterium]